MDNIIDSFTAKLKKYGGSLVLVIPAATVKFAGLKRDEWLKFYFKKQKEKGDQECKVKEQEDGEIHSQEC